MPVTIREIAEAAGVSKATVSYVVNGRPGVSEETRRRILGIIEQNGYRPNATARGLARQKTDTLGLVIPDISDMFYADIVRAVERTANEHNLTLNLCTTRSDPRKERHVVDLLTSGRVDGVILMTYHLEPVHLEGVRMRGRPFVLLADQEADESLYSVSVDNVEAGYKAAEYLLRLGHRKIAFIHGSRLSRDTWLRYKGFQQALAAAGCPLRPEYVAVGEFQREGGYEAAQGLFALPDPPTALLAANDQMAIGAVAAGMQAGLRVPDDISVVGVDDIEAAATLHPGLTTVRQPTYEMGRLAVQMLVDLLQGRVPRSRKVVLPPALVVRGSCRAL